MVLDCTFFASREIFTTPGHVTARRSILGPPAEGRPGPSISNPFNLINWIANIAQSWYLTVLITSLPMLSTNSKHNLQQNITFRKFEAHFYFCPGKNLLLTCFSERRWRVCDVVHKIEKLEYGKWLEPTRDWCTSLLFDASRQYQPWRGGRQSHPTPTITFFVRPFVGPFFSHP